MDNNKNWRGRGRGRGRGNYNGPGRDHGQSNDGPSVLSRLGPTNAPIVENPPNQGDRRTFSKNKRNNYGKQGPNPRFNNEFMEDVDMSSDASSENVVTVTGYPPGTEEILLQFLARKSKTKWEPVYVDYGESQVRIELADSKTAYNICRMNGYTFSNAILTITQGRNKTKTNRSDKPARTNETGGRSAYLAEFLQERWSAQAGYLDMDDLPPSTYSLFLVITKLLTEAKHLFGDSVITISFAKNKLWSVKPLTKIAEYFPNLKNLSLQDNMIAEFRNLDQLSNKLPQLQELMLSGNPIQEKDNYKSEVIKRFPSIQCLDLNPVQVISGFPQQQAVPLAAPLAVPVRSNFFDQDSSRIAAQDMLSKYFPLFDTNRKLLLDLYDVQSTLSVVFNKGDYNQENTWGSSQARPSQRIAVGNEAIIKRLCALPATIHDLSRAENFVIDAWQTQGNQPNYPVLLFLTVHGEFVESHFGTSFSFDRSFLVAPSTPGSRAHAAGWSYVILSDSLIVRPFSCKPASLITA